MKHAGAIIDTVVKRKGLVKKEIAEQLGVSNTHFVQMMHKDTLNCKMLEKICKIIGISPAYFFDDWPDDNIFRIEDLGQRGGNGEPDPLLFKLLEEKERTIKILMDARK